MITMNGCVLKTDNLINGNVFVYEDEQTLTAVISYDCLSDEIKNYLKKDIFLGRDCKFEEDNTRITIIAYDIFDKSERYFKMFVEHWDLPFDENTYDGGTSDLIALELSDTESEKIIQAMKKSIANALAKV